LHVMFKLSISIINIKGKLNTFIVEFKELVSDNPFRRLPIEYYRSYYKLVSSIRYAKPRFKNLDG
jgi:hypothetical protein